MKLTLAAAAGMVALGLTTSPASAVPMTGTTNPAVGERIAEPVQYKYKYHAKCVWGSHGDWHYYQHGKWNPCRPYKPHGAGWYWYSEGGKHGWYHKKHSWHYKKYH